MTILACTGVVAGCQSVGPIEPTIAVLPSSTVTATIPEPTHAPTATLPPTWTPHLTQTFPPRPATFTPAPPTVTMSSLDKTAAAPIAATNSGTGAVVLLINEPQLNAALKRKYDDAPLADYSEAPRIMLQDGTLSLTLRIVPLNAPPNSSPQTITLTGAFTLDGGVLDLDPNSLSPLDVGVTTRQVKRAHVLLVQTVNDLAREATGAPEKITYNFVSIAPAQLSLTVVTR